MDRAALQVCGPLDLQGERMSIPEKILQAGCDAYAATFLNGDGSLGDGIEAAYLAIQHHDDWVHAGPPAWTGEGLPPVGMVCEFDGFNPEETMPTDPRVGDQVTVIAHFMSGSFEVAAFTFYAPPEFKYLQVAQGAYGCFRPIRTAEQIAEEARIAEINMMIRHIKDHPAGRHGANHLAQLKIQEEACMNLYDAGYRKQV